MISEQFTKLWDGMWMSAIIAVVKSPDSDMNTAEYEAKKQALFNYVATLEAQNKALAAINQTLIDAAITYYFIVGGDAYWKCDHCQSASQDGRDEIAHDDNCPVLLNGQILTDGDGDK